MFRLPLLLIALGIATSAAAKTFAWEEDVLLHDGRTFPVKRLLERGDGNASLPGSGALKRQSIEFQLRGKTITWLDDQKRPYLTPVAFEIVGGNPVVVLPVHGWYACWHFGFPPEALAALRWRDGRWARMPLANLPAGLRKNLLPSPQWLEQPEWKGRRIDDAARRKLDYGLGSPGNPEALDAIGRKHARMDGACARLRPPPDPAMDAARAGIEAAQARATRVTAVLEREATQPETVSAADYKRAVGSWTGAASLGDDCRGVVETVEGYNTSTGDADGYSSALAGYEVVLAEPRAGKKKIAFAGHRLSMQRVVCGAGILYVARRGEKASLAVHRFRDDGTLIDAVAIALPGAERLGDKGWGTLWEMTPTPEGLRLVLADYAYPQLANLGGTITRKHVYSANLPAPR